MLSNLALLGALAFVGFGLWSSLRTPNGNRAQWKLPAALAALFFFYSVWTIANEGPFGFWVNHTSNFWGVQVWFDLILAAAIGWYALLPRMRKAGMNLIFWFLMVAASGSIGILAALARLQYLEKEQAA